MIFVQILALWFWVGFFYLLRVRPNNGTTYNLNLLECLLCLMVILPLVMVILIFKAFQTILIKVVLIFHGARTSSGATFSCNNCNEMRPFSEHVGFGVCVHCVSSTRMSRKPKSSSFSWREEGF